MSRWDDYKKAMGSTTATVGASYYGANDSFDAYRRYRSEMLGREFEETEKERKKREAELAKLQKRKNDTEYEQREAEGIAKWGDDALGANKPQLVPKAVEAIADPQNTIQVENGQKPGAFDPEEARRKAEGKIRAEQVYAKWNEDMSQTDPNFNKLSTEEKYNMFAEQIKQEQIDASRSNGMRQWAEELKGDPDFERMSEDEKYRQYMLNLDRKAEELGTLPEEQRAELSEYKYSRLTDKERKAIDSVMRVESEEYDAYKNGNQETQFVDPTGRGTWSQQRNQEANDALESKKAARERTLEDARAELKRLGWDDAKIDKEFARYRELEDWNKAKKEEQDVVDKFNDPTLTDFEKSALGAGYTVADWLSFVPRAVETASTLPGVSKITGADVNGAYGRNTSSRYSSLGRMSETGISQVRDNLLKDHPIAQGAYSMGVSAGESLATGLLAGALGSAGETVSLGAFALNTFDSSYREAVNRGFSDEQAQAYAAVMGGIEAATEKLPLDRLKEIAKGNKIGRNMITRLLLSMGIEGGEEVASEIGQLLTDHLAVEIGKTGKTQFMSDVEGHMAQDNMTEEEAIHAALGDFGNQVLNAFVSGAGSAGMSTIAAEGIGAMNRAARGEDGRVATGENISKAIANRYGNLEIKGESDYEQALKADKERYQNNPTQFVVDQYKVDENDKDSKRIKKALQDIADKEREGKKLSMSDKAFIAENANVDQAFIDKLYDTGEDANIPYKYRDVKTEVTEDDARKMLAEAAKAGDAQAFIDAMQKTRNSSVEDVAKNAEEIISLYSGMAQEHGITKQDIANAVLTQKKAYIEGLEGNQLDKETLTPENQIAYNEGLQQNLENKARIIVSGKEAVDNAIVKKHDGSSVKLTGVFDKGGIVTENGESVKIEDLDLTGETAVTRAYAFADQYKNINTKTAFMSAIGDNTDIDMYADGFHKIYDLGMAGVSLDNAKKGFSFLSDEQKTIAYEAGAREAKIRAAKELDKAWGVQRKGTGSVINEAGIKDQKVVEFLEKIAQKAGIDIRISDKDINGVKGARGMFSASKSTIFVKADKAIAVYHELGEFAETYNKKGYEELKKAIADVSVKKFGADTYSNMLSEYKRLYGTAVSVDKEGNVTRVQQDVSADEMSGEMLNDSIAAMLSTDEGSQMFADYLAGNYVPKKARTIGQQASEVVKKLSDTIKRLTGSEKEEAYSLGNRENDSKTRYAQNVYKIADELAKHADKFIEVLDTAIQNYQAQTEGVGGADKFSITIDSTEDERYQELKEKDINIPHYQESKLQKDIDSLKTLSLKEAYGAIRRLARKLEVFDDYSNPNIEVEFAFSSNNLDESLHQQTKVITGDGKSTRFAQMLTCFKDVVENAELIEAHKDRYEGKKRGDKDLKQVFVLASAFEDSNGIVPIKLEVKDFEKKKDVLYVSIVMPTIEKSRLDVVESENKSLDHAKDKLFSTYRLSSLLAEVKKNPNADSLGQYIPIQFGSDEQSVNETTEAVGIHYDSQDEMVYPGDYSLETWDASDYQTNRKEAAKDLAKAMGITQKKALEYIDDINSIARIIADDRVRLDYDSDEGSAVVSNSDYGASIDFSTICKKRLLYTGTLQQIQKQIGNRVITVDDYLAIRQAMLRDNLETTCGCCYVEGSRAKLGGFMKEFIRKYAKTKPEYIPTMYDVSTPDGIRQLRTSHPEVYKARDYFLNHYGRIDANDKETLFASQQKPKDYTERKAYKGEIIKMFKGKNDKVADKNLNGGLRLQSFSDFEVVNLLDCMQVITDMSRVGLAGQAYTKVKNFADALGNTGLKINLSLMAKGVDKNGKLILDEVNGMKKSDAEYLRNKYSKNVGTIIVCFTDEQIKAAMNDNMIDFIIPFHRSQWQKSQYEALGLPEGTKDYTNYQEDGVIGENGRRKRADHSYMSKEYWDFSKSGRENAETYIKMCNDNNKVPVFDFLLEKDKNGKYVLPEGADGYFKLLIDFKMYDNNGVGSPQLPVTPNFSLKECKAMLDSYEGGHESFPVNQKIADEFTKKITKREKEFKYSLEVDTEGNKLSEGQAEYFKDSVIRDDNGKLKIMYHGTQNDFTIFDPKKLGGKNGTAEGYGIYFTENPEISQAYGGNQMKGYLNVTNPARYNEKTIKAKDLAKLIKATAEAQAKELLDEGYDSIEDALKDSWISNVEYTYDKPVDQVYRIVAQKILDMNHNDMDIIQEVMADQAIRNYEEAYEFYDILKDTLGIDGFITEWEDSRTGEKNEVVVAIDSNQFKNIDNENPTENEDIRYSLDVGYHAGDLGKAESLFQQSGGRSTGHFGTGTYFVGDEEKINSLSGYKDRPHYAVDFSNYNLYKPSSSAKGLQLHDFLKDINSFYNTAGDAIRTERDWEVRKDDLEYVLDEDNFEGKTITKAEALAEARRLFGAYELQKAISHELGDGYWYGNGEVYDEANDRNMSYEEAVADWDWERFADMIARIIWDNKYAPNYIGHLESFDRDLATNAMELFGITEDRAREIIKGIRDEIQAANYGYNEMKVADSASTRFMKALGYEGVDVRGLNGLDNTTYGSVIYDLKGKDLEQKIANGARYSLEMDSEGNSLSEDQKEYFKNSKIRDDNGNLKVMYHGSNAGGFTVFDPKKADDNISLFFTDSPDVADSYVNWYGMEKPRTAAIYKSDQEKITDAETAKQFLESLGFTDIVSFQEGKYTRWSYTDPNYGSRVRGVSQKDLIAEANSLRKGRKGLYKVYLDIQNPLVVDCGIKIEGVVDDVTVSNYKNNTAFTYTTPLGINTVEIADSKVDSYIEETFGKDADKVKQAVKSIGTISFEDFSDAVKDYTDGENFATRDGNDVVIMEVGEATDDIEIYRGTLQGAIDFFNKTIHINTPLKADVYRHIKNINVNTVVPSNWNNIKFEGGRANTRHIAGVAHERGYDGVYFKNIMDNGGQSHRSVSASNIAVAFNSDQVKAVDNEHPTTDSDIRYSIETDSRDHELTEGQQRYFNNTKVVDSKGRLKVMYHGARGAGFTVFNNRYSDDKRSFFFTDNPVVAESYSGTKETFHPDEPMSYEELSDFAELVSNGDVFVKKDGNDIIVMEYVLPGDPASEVYRGDLNGAKEYIVDFNTEYNFSSDSANYEVYLNLQNPFIFEAKGASWDELADMSAWDQHFGDVQINKTDAGYDVEWMGQDFEWYHDTFKSMEDVEKKFGKIYEPFMADEIFISDIYLDKDGNRIPTNTRMIAQMAQEQGYDGVIFKDMVDMGMYSSRPVSSTIAIAFNPEQIKSVYNINPTSSEDIRYSLEDVDDWVDFDAILSEDSPIKTNEEKAIDILEKGMEALKNKEVDVSRLRNLAIKLRNEYGSSYNVKTLTENLRKAFAYMQTEDHVDYKTMMGILRDIARPVVEASGEKVGEQEYKDFISYFKDKKIKLTAKQKDEVKNTFGTYGAFRNAIMPITISDNASTTLDQLWDEIVDHSGYVLDRDTTEGNMPLALLDTLQAMRPTVRNDFGGDMDDMARDLAMRIVQEYIEGEAAKQMKQEISEIRKRLKKDYQERYSNLKGKANAEIKARNKRRAEEAKERELVRNLKHDIKISANKLLTWVQKPTEGKSIPHDMMMPVMQFLQAIDFVDPIIRFEDGKYRTKVFQRMDYEDGHKKFIYKDLVGDTLEDVLRQFNEAIGRGEGSKEQRSWAEKMQGIRDIYNKVLTDSDFEDNSMDFLMQALDAQGLAEEFDDLLSRNRGQADMNHLSSKDLSLINNVIKNIFKAVNQGNKAYSSANVDLANLAQSTIQDAEGKDIKSRGKIAEGLHKMLRLDNVNPRTFFKLLGKRGNEVYKFLRGGLNQEILDLKKASDFMTEAMKGIDAKKWTGNNATVHEFALSSGTVRMTDAQIMGLYFTIRRNGGMERIKGGVKVDDIRVKGRPIQQKAVHLTENDIKQLEAVLTPEQIELGKKMQRYMAEDCSAMGNETSMRLYGYKKFTDDTYYPWTVDKDTVATNNTSENIPMFTGIERSGFTKQLKEGATNPLVIRDIFDVFTDHVSQMAAYHGYAASVKDTLRWMNYRERSENNGFVNWITNKNAINTLTGSKKGVNYIQTLLLDINKANQSQYIGNFTDMLIGNYKAAAVGANLRVVAQQPTAYFRALNMISPKYLLSVNPATAIKNIKRSQEECPISWWKSKGYYETNLGQPIKEIVTGISSTAEKAKDIMMSPAGWADDFTWGFLYTAVEKEQKAKYKGQNITEEELRKAINERFDDVVDNTQVVDSTLHRSQYMRSTDRLNKIQTAFMAEPTKSYNMLLEAVIEDMNEGKTMKRSSRAVSAFLLSALATSAAAAVVDAMRKAGDDDKWWEVWLKNLKENMADNMNPFNLLPVVKDVSAGIYNLFTGSSTFGQSGNRFDIEAISSIMDAASAWSKLIEGDSKKTGYGMVMATIKPISQITGIPVYNLTKDTVGLYNAFFKNIETTINSGNPTRTDAKKDVVSVVDKEKSEEKIEKNITDAINKGVSIYDLKQNLANEYKQDYFDAFTEGDEEKARDIANKAAGGFAVMGMSDEEIDDEINSWQEEVLTYAPLDKAIADGENISVEVMRLRNVKSDEKIMKHILDRFASTIQYEDTHDTESSWRENVERAIWDIDPTTDFDTEYNKAVEDEAKKKEDAAKKAKGNGMKAEFFDAVDKMDGSEGRKVLEAMKAEGMEGKSVKSAVSSRYHDMWKEATSQAEKDRIKSAWKSAYTLVNNVYGEKSKDLDKTWSDWEKKQ